MLWVCGRRRDDWCPTPLHGDFNSQFTAPDAKEQIWANPWHDLMVNCWRPVLWVSESSCPVHTGVSAGGVSAELVTCGIPVRADFLHPCSVMWFCILHVFVFYILHVHKPNCNPLCLLGLHFDPWVKGVLVHGVMQQKASGGAARGISSSSCCSALVLAQLFASSHLCMLQLAEPMSLCSTKGNILLAPLELPSLLPF